MILRKRIGVALAVGVTIGAGITGRLPASARQAPTSPAQTSPPPAGNAQGFSAAQRSTGPAGQSTTRLPDGRYLLLGGVGPAGPIGSGVIVDARTGASTSLAGSLVVPRAGHTATVLADGSVLIAGGRTPNGVAAVAERFDPATQTFTAVGIDGSTPRFDHTATLLMDGRVLIAGGSADHGAGPPIEIWDLDAQTVTPFPANLDRAGHHATLLPDGAVLVSGGHDGTGEMARSAEILDPTTLRIVSGEGAAPTVESGALAPTLSASSPAAGDEGVALNARIALRFSAPMALETLNGQIMRLTGPEGALAIRVVGAEQGRLAFVWPVDPLQPGETYVFTIDRAVSEAGIPLAPTSIPFTTVERVTQQDPVNEEAWVPNPDGGANTWRSDRPRSPWEDLPPLQAPEGVTALAGRVLRLDGQPLPDVTLEIEQHVARTDHTGRFLLRLDGFGSGERTLDIDARTASRGQRTYGFYEARIRIAAGLTTVLPFTIWSPLLDTAHEVTIPSPTTSETVVSTPTLPGLELHLPPGTVIRDEDGEIVRRVSITPIPLDRTPFPLPSDATFRIFFTIQPGGAYIYTPGPTRGAWIVYPNNTGFPIGTRVQFFNYDPDDLGWHVYGMGVVTPTQVVPEPRTRLYAFTGASFNSGSQRPAGGSGPDGDREADPIDPSTGAFIMEKTDLYLPDVMPLALTRTYNSQDVFARQFGIGMTQSYALFQFAEDAEFADGYVILPDGRGIYYVRISDPGLPWQQTVFECQSSPTRFYRSRITFNGNAFEDRLTDGTVYTFGHGAPLQSIRDRYGNETRFTYAQTNAFGNGYGDLLRITSPNGRWIEFTYYAGTTRVYQARDNLARTVTYTYDPSGRLSTVTDPENNVTRYTWNAANRIETVKDGREIVYLTLQYDPDGRVLNQRLADPAASYTFDYTVDGSGNVTQTDLTNPRGYTTRFSFYPTHHLETRVEALGEPEERRTRFYRESGSNLVTAMVDGLLRRTEYEYDDSGHVLAVKQLADTAQPVITQYTYEQQFFQLETVTDPLQHTSTIDYDAAGRVASVTDALTHQTTFTTNVQGLIATVTDPLQHTWEFGYTGADQTSTRNPLGHTWRSFVDAGGRVLSTTDPLGRVTRLMPDKLNQIRTITDALGGQTSFDHDPNGRVLSLTDALTHATTYTYDVSDRLETREDPLQARARYVYDRNGNLTEMTDRKEQVTSYEYDPLDRLKRVTYADSSTVEYVYDAGDRLRQIIDATAGTIARDYDLLDRLTSETTPEGSISYTYDLDGRRETMTVAGQPTVTYGYDDAHRLTSITQGTSVVSMTYDNADRRETLTLPNGIVTTSGYDDANRLTSLTYTVLQTTLGTLTYTYDDVGNRVSVGGTWARTGLPQAVASATYDAANRIATWAGTTFSYDANGNLASDGATSYLWNPRNHLAGLTGAVSASYGYDGLARRRTKTVSGAMKAFFYDGVNAVQELAGGVPVATLLTGGIDEVFERSEPSEVRNYLTDALGSSVALADGSGTVQTEYTYQPFGATTTTGVSTSNTFAFTGREADGTGLYYYRARYYHPNTQRFVAEDPVDFSGGDINLHAYVGSSPTNFTDPGGDFAPWAAACLGGAAWDAGWYAATNGRKSTWGGVFGAAGRGCAAGLIGLGVGRAAAAAAAAARRGAGQSRAVNDAVRAIRDFLGEGARTMRNSSDDLIAVSRDGTRRVRFDINNPHPHANPHGHVEVFENGRWTRSGPIYPRDISPR